MLLIYYEKLYWYTDRSNRIGKLNELSGTVEYIAYTTGSPRGIAVDPFNRCVCVHVCVHACMCVHAYMCICVCMRVCESVLYIYSLN